MFALSAPEMTFNQIISRQTLTNFYFLFWQIFGYSSQFMRNRDCFCHNRTRQSDFKYKTRELLTKICNFVHFSTQPNRSSISMLNFTENIHLCIPSSSELEILATSIWSKGGWPKKPLSKWLTRFHMHFLDGAR